jgi:hypothetical protein
VNYFDKTEDCVFVTTHFHMGIGRMRQIRNLEVVTDADKNQLRHQKKLMESETLEEIRSQDGKMKRYLETHTARYSESTGFLPKTYITEVDRAMQAYQTLRRPKLVADFMAEYRAMEAVDFQPLRETLKEHFVRSDYPKSDVVERGFIFDFHYRPVGKVGLEGIDNVIIQREVEKELEMRKAAIEEWKDTMRFTALKMVEAVADVLKPETGKRKRLDTQIEKLQEYLDTATARDLADDTELQQHLKSLKQLLGGESTEYFRSLGKDVKADIAAQAAKIADSIRTLIQVSGRKFR